jgi:hypothetical protein
MPALPATVRRAAGALKRSPKAAVRHLRGAALRRAVERAWDRRGVRPAPKAHGLPGELIVSLTSYKPRFATLAPTLKCLLLQTVATDRTILWISESDVNALPAEIVALTGEGLTIAATKDLRSYKKIVPSLRLAPHAFIVTADDDIHYEPTWLEHLVRAYRHAGEIVCRRAHAITLLHDAPAPYTRWRHDVANGPPSPLLFPTGGGGVLYPPGALHADVLDEETFTALCPTADDVWLYFMGRRAGAIYRRVGPRRDIIPWPGSQSVALLRHNVGDAHGNDAQIARLIARYGFPAAA